MPSKYTYSILNDFPNGKVDVAKLSSEVVNSDFIYTSLHDILTSGDDCDIYFISNLDNGEHTTLSGVVSKHDGIPYSSTEPVEIVSEYRDRSGKLRVHQTSRKLGLITCWFGCGDDQSDPYYVGGGESLSFTHSIGDPEPAPVYIDFNIVDNETWMHEGYITWADAQLDTISLDMLPRVTSVVPASGTSYTLYNGYLVVPTYPGTGDIDIMSDITTASGGLVYMPDDDLGNNPTAFWNADWDYDNKCYTNISPAPNGDGRYNMFAAEIVFHRLVHEMPLLKDGFLPLNCSDTEQLGHGMRLRMFVDTNNNVADHKWSIAVMLCMHRKKTFNNEQYI